VGSTSNISRSFVDLFLCRLTLASFRGRFRSFGSYLFTLLGGECFCASLPASSNESHKKSETLASAASDLAGRRVC
jgi:hypothetical protein